MSDLTIVYITSNTISNTFGNNIRNCLLRNCGDTDIVSVSKESLNFGRNTISSHIRSHINIYRDALIGVKEATTKYVAICEDDVLYSSEHFMKRPTKDDVFAYNIACWSIYTWSNPPIYSYSGRRNHGMLICAKDLYIEAMEERFAKFTDDSQINNAVWAEPGKYESQLGVTVRQTEVFYTDPSNVMFTHPQGLSMDTLGMRKRLAPIRAVEIPHWGTAEAIVRLYE